MEIACHQLLSLLRFAIANTNFRETRERERDILDLVKLHEENGKARSAERFIPESLPRAVPFSS